LKVLSYPETLRIDKFSEGGTVTYHLKPKKIRLEVVAPLEEELTVFKTYQRAFIFAVVISEIEPRVRGKKKAEVPVFYSDNPLEALFVGRKLAQILKLLEDDSFSRLETLLKELEKEAEGGQEES